MARNLAQLTDSQVGSVAWVRDDNRPLAAPPSGSWLELEEFDEPVTGDIFSSVCPVRFAPPFDATRYNVIQVDPPQDGGRAWWLYNTQGQAVSFEDATGRWHWLNTLPTGTPNVWLPGEAAWRKYEADGLGRAVWVQPTGAYDAYPLGFEVVHDPPGNPVRLQLFRSLIPANTTQPGTEAGQFWQNLGNA